MNNQFSRSCLLLVSMVGLSACHFREASLRDECQGSACSDGGALVSDDASSAEGCGNGIVESETREVCDDGNVMDGDGCSALCHSNESCGNGVLDSAAGELCDDGNSVDGDGCSADCLSRESCGNRIVDSAAGEACDDGNAIDGDGCSAACRSNESCGNGIVDGAVGEVCEDGNAASGDGCSADCLSDESCGNGIVDSAAGEACDDLNTVNADGCSADCASDESCGNGIVDSAAGEACDDGNAIAGDGCSALCALELCATVTNTALTDITDPGWFDACVDAPGDSVRLILRDEAGAILYTATGPKNNGWSGYDRITNPADDNVQYYMVRHDNRITLSNGDSLLITGKSSDAGACGGSLGIGYGIMVLSTVDGAVGDHTKLFVASHLPLVGTRKSREIGRWGASYEISYAGGVDMRSCFPYFGSGPGFTPSLGAFEFYVY